jgi:hypothetical protein
MEAMYYASPPRAGFFLADITADAVCYSRK